MAATRTIHDATLIINWDDQGGWFQCPMCSSSDTMFVAAHNVHGIDLPDRFRCWRCDWQASGE